MFTCIDTRVCSSFSGIYSKKQEYLFSLIMCIIAFNLLLFWLNDSIVDEFFSRLLLNFRDVQSIQRTLYIESDPFFKRFFTFVKFFSFLFLSFHWPVVYNSNKKSSRLHFNEQKVLNYSKRGGKGLMWVFLTKLDV